MRNVLHWLPFPQEIKNIYGFGVALKAGINVPAKTLLPRLRCTA